MRIAGLTTIAALVAALAAAAPASAEPGFSKSWLAGEASEFPTSLQWGPDDRLYVAEFSGLIRAYTVARSASNAYAVTAAETIDLVAQIPNHTDDGQPDPGTTGRLVTGILVTGTAASPVVYVASSDPRTGGGPGATDLNLDTNSGIVSRLTRTDGSWARQDLVRGLPRSEENHTVNGLALSADESTLYVAQGGNTNHGAPSLNFVSLPEYAYSAAILSIDLDAIGSGTHDLPTLNDQTRPGSPDAGDPFGGNNALNQAKLTPGSPVQVHAPGFRNAYDLVRTSDDRLFTIDNGGNAGWGGFPSGEGSTGTCTNDAVEDGETVPDTLHLVTAGYYGGHPNPARASLANTFNPANPQAAITSANPIECDARPAGTGESTALATFGGSTTGLAEYTSPGELQGDLIAAGFGANALYRITRTAAGDGVASVSTLASALGASPLDVHVADASTPFPGTVWVADFEGVGGNTIHVLEPSNGLCGGPPTADDDADGFTNSDESDNGTNPCSQADQPPDADGDHVSDRNDPDDDNDGRPDTNDPFAVDAQNGLGTALPVTYTWDNGAPDPGGLLGLGFTGLMSDGVTDYRGLFDPDALTTGGAAGVLTLDAVGPGDATGTLNGQTQAFQFGVDPTSSSGTPFEIRSRILDPFASRTLTGHESAGIYVGTGTQDDYVRIVAGIRNGVTGVWADREGAATLVEGAHTAHPLPLAGAGPRAVELFLVVDPSTSSVQPAYRITAGDQIGPKLALGPPLDVPAAWLAGAGTGLAAGIIGTSRAGVAFPATWDSIAAGPVTEVPEAAVPAPPAGAPTPEGDVPGLSSAPEPASPGLPSSTPRPRASSPVARFAGRSRALAARRGVVAITLRCDAPAGARCRGRATLDSAVRVRVTPASPARRARLSARTFSLTAGCACTLSFRLTRAGARLLLGRRALAAALRVETQGSSGGRLARSVRVTIRDLRPRR